MTSGDVGRRYRIVDQARTGMTGGDYITIKGYERATSDNGINYPVSEE